MRFTTDTTGRFGSLHPRPNREPCRWVSRPHRASSPHQCLPVRFVQLIVVDDSFNRLKPRAISGEIATPCATGACDMRSTGTGSDPVFAHADPRFGPWAVLPPDGDVPHRTDRGHFTIAAETSPAPTASVCRETSDYPPMSHPHRGRVPMFTVEKTRGRTIYLHHAIPMSRTAIPPNTSSPSSSDKRRQEVHSRCPAPVVRATMCAVATRRPE